VLVPGSLADGLLELLAPEVRRRQESGGILADAIRHLLGELAWAGKCCSAAVPSGVPTRSAVPILNGMTTREAAEQLDITERGVLARIYRGRLDAQQQDDGRWLVRLPEGAA
jgi:hypothetical protein